MAERRVASLRRRRVASGRCAGMSEREGGPSEGLILTLAVLGAAYLL